MQINQEQKKKTNPIFESSARSSRTRACCRVPRRRLPQAQRRWQRPDAGGTQRRYSSKWKHQSLCSTAEKLKQCWPCGPSGGFLQQLKLGALKWPVTVLSLFYHHTDRGKKKKETTHSGSSKWLRTSDAPAPRKGKSCVRIHSGRAAMICRLHTYLHKRKK